MNAFFASLLSYLLIYKYALLAGAIFASGVIPVPVDTLLLAAGAFASQGYFSLAFSLAAAVGANVAADSMVYFIARRYGPPALRFFKVERSATVLRLEGYIRSRAGVTIFLSRFVSALDIAANVLAGLTKVPFHYFLAFDLLGNATDIGALLFLGYFFGANWQSVSNTVGGVGLVLLVVIPGIFYVSYRQYHAAHKKQ